jgi:hypothetical protein
MIFDCRPVFTFFVICSNGVEQMKNCADQFFRANKFRAVDHDPYIALKYQRIVGKLSSELNSFSMLGFNNESTI